MSKSMENVKTVNSFIRTVLMVGFLGAFGFFGYAGYSKYIKPGMDAERLRSEMANLQVKFEKQNQELAQTNQELAKTKTALKLIKVDRRKAQIKVLDKGVVKETGEEYFDVEFVEVDKNGKPIGDAKEFTLKGNFIFVDCWVVKFEDQYIQEEDALRNASLCVFKSIYGDKDGRENGYSLERVDQEKSTAYGSREMMTDFEKQIWEDFWELANDSSGQNGLGIRGIHGQINYIPVEPGKTYDVDLRVSDGVTLRPAKDNSTTTTTNRPAG